MVKIKYTNDYMNPKFLDKNIYKKSSCNQKFSTFALLLAQMAEMVDAR